MSAVATAQPKDTSWITVAAIIGAAMAAAFQVGKMPAALPILRAELALSLVAAGWIISIFNVVSVVFGIATGAFTDWLGPRRAVIGGLILIAAAGVAGAMAPTGGVLLLTRIFEGLGFTAVVVAGPALLVAATAQRDQRLAFGCWGTYLPGGASLIMLVSTVLLGTIGWRGLWLVVAGLVLVSAALLARATRDVRPLVVRQSSGDALRGIRQTMTSRGPLLLALTFAGYSVVYMTIISFLPTLLVAEMGITLALAAGLTAGIAFVNVFGNLLGGLALHRGVPRGTLLAVGFLGIAVAGFGVFDDSLSLSARVFAGVIVSLVGGVIPVSCLSGAPVHAPRPQMLATTNGLIVQGSNVGQLVGPPATAAAVEATEGWGVAAWVLAAAAAFGMVSALGIGRLERARARRETRVRPAISP